LAYGGITLDITNIKVRSDDLTILNDLLNIQEEEFKDAQSNMDVKIQKGWEELLEDAGSFSDVIASINRIKEAIEDGQPD
jgi:hypothetical protein